MNQSILPTMILQKFCKYNYNEIAVNLQNFQEWTMVLQSIWQTINIYNLELLALLPINKWDAWIGNLDC